VYVRARVCVRVYLCSVTEAEKKVNTYADMKESQVNLYLLLRKNIHHKYDGILRSNIGIWNEIEFYQSNHVLQIFVHEVFHPFIFVISPALYIFMGKYDFFRFYYFVFG